MKFQTFEQLIRQGFVGATGIGCRNCTGEAPEKVTSYSAFIMFTGWEFTLCLSYLDDTQPGVNIWTEPYTIDAVTNRGPATEQLETFMDQLRQYLHSQT